MIVLGIETATDVCAVALLRGEGADPARGALLASAAVAVPRSHATRLAPLVEQMLAHARVAPADLDLVAVSAGPGSYTGLRIGASTARGLCLATGAALVGVGTLDALAAEAQPLVHDGEMLVVALPSRRGEVYWGRTDPRGRLAPAQVVSLADASAVAAEALGAWAPADRRIAVAGPAAALVRDALSAGGHSIRLVDVRPSAERVARLGQALHAAGHGASDDAFEPAYLGSFVALPPAR